jgi:hypothetical protein
VNLRLAQPDSDMVRAATVSSIQFGRPSEVADLAAAILTDAYLTNRVISLDGITQVDTKRRPSRRPGRPNRFPPITIRRDPAIGATTKTTDTRHDRA